MTDELILELVRTLDGKSRLSDDFDDDGFQYFVEGKIMFHKRPFRLIWCIPPSFEYIGVVNAFRIKEIK